MRIGVGSDHAGFRLKQKVVAHLIEGGHVIIDLGAVSDETSVDYPDYAREVAQSLQRGDADLGVLVCGTGQGMAMTANRFRNVRAAVVADPFSARMAREHNDANVLCLGARVVGEGLALECLNAWLDAAFEGGRHQRRVSKIDGDP